MSPTNIVLDGRTYAYAQTIQTILSADYVPDWDAAKAVKESVQNQLDECLTAKCAPALTVIDADHITLADSGRGVDLDTILLLGQSGKRGDDATVGEHGEGEMISSLVAARSGFVKLLASQDWLMTGRLANYNGGGKQVLTLDVYQTATPRRGTYWSYAGPGVARDAANAYEAFARHPGLNYAVYPHLQCKLAAVGVNLADRPPKASSPLIITEAGQLYSRGQRVGEQWNLALSYNVSQSPGRDRAAFSWEHVRTECGEIFARYADADAIAAVLKYAANYGAQPEEFRFMQAPPARIVAAGVKQFKMTAGLKKLSWATTRADDAAQIADASAMTNSKVLTGYYAPPAWVTDAIPNVSEIVTVKAQQALQKPIPEPVLHAAQTLLACCGMVETPIEGRALKDECDGAGDATRIILNTDHISQWSWERFVTVVIHEAAHVASEGASDCTRKHANQISELSVGVMEYCADDPSIYIKARKMYCAWREANHEPA